MKLYKWNIDVVLKGSGVILHCVYEGVEDNTTDVYTKLFAGRGSNGVIGLSGNNGNSNVFIVCGEIASVDIYKK